MSDVTHWDGKFVEPKCSCPEDAAAMGVGLEWYRWMFGCYLCDELRPV